MMQDFKYYCDKCGKELALIAEREKGIESRKAKFAREILKLLEIEEVE